MSISSALSENAARMVFRVTGECLTAGKSIEGFAHPDPEIRNSEKANYEQHLVKAIASALAIKDEFYKGLAIHKVINLCRSSNELDIAKTLFKEVDHPSLREQIVKDAPELAGERKIFSHERTFPIDGFFHVQNLFQDQFTALKQPREMILVQVNSPDLSTTRLIAGFPEGTSAAQYEGFVEIQPSELPWTASFLVGHPDRFKELFIIPFH